MRECVTHHICDCHRERMDALEAALMQIRAEVEPVRTRRVRRNGVIKAICDAALATRAGADAKEGQ